MTGNSDSATPVVYLVRHAEAEHNVSKDFSHRDPPLTKLGLSQASAIATSFNDAQSVAVVMTSPLTRTLQTTLAAFATTLDSSSLKSGGREDGARLLIDRDLQERSNLPCDTGSPRASLEEAFPALSLDDLDDHWFVKEGPYAHDETTVRQRAQRVRQKLVDVAGLLESGMMQRRNIVVVTHGVFMKFLAEDLNLDLPKAAWKAYKIESGVDGKATLVALDPTA
jgi:broad specificity phosphatase PhoE